MHLLTAKMERRKEFLNEIKLCRFCLTKDSSLSSLYDRSQDPTLVNLPLKIMACVSIEVFPSDKMLSYICERCRTFMDICYDFKQICRRADESCLQFVQSGVPITGIPWPSQLAQIFSLAKRARLINTVIDGSAAIQVSSQNTSENEEDEETYNLKIGNTGGGSAQGSPGGQSTAAPKKAVVKGVMVRVRRRSAGQRTWSCEQCDNSYSLHQLLEIHKARKHRAMNLKCTKCDAKFFAIYDLLIHMLRHKNDRLFQCSACDIKFKRMLLLKRHEKMVHSDLAREPCPSCPATFLSSVELEAHKKRHDIKYSREHVCTLCDRKFHTRGTLQRHREVIHGRKHFSCEYCPQRFQTVAKLSRHVRTHAGDRAYPCKHCNKSFLKFRHYTRHLRVKHEAETRAARGTNAFRCEQCRESFATQDELYYHSAIHATENLICPLCQEKFENVDAVTTHIRTHVNGIEFMCEYCELVFTSKEKLDAHTIAAHDDEIAPSQEMDDSSTEADIAEADGEVEDDDEDNGINVKEVGDHMVVEISKADGYMLQKNIEEGQINITTHSEDSEMEAPYPEVPVVILDAEITQAKPSAAPMRSEATSSRSSRASTPKTSERVGILRKAEAIKRRAAEKEVSNVPLKKDRVVNVDSTTNIAGSSVKSLRLLEKELQDLTRTNQQADAKAGDAKSKRQPVLMSTPKLRPADEKKPQPKPAVEMKAAEQRSVTKDTKEPKEKELRNTVSSSKEDKNVSSTKDDIPGSSDKKINQIDNKSDTGTASTKDEVSALEKLVKKAAEEVSNLVLKYEKTKEPKSKGGNTEEQPSSSKSEVASTGTKASAEPVENSEFKEEQEPVKNGDTSSSEDNIIRRSTRPSKIKNYASMIRDRTRLIRDEDDDQNNSDDDDVVELKEADSRISASRRVQPKRQKPPTPPTPPSGSMNAALAHIVRRRGRPRKSAVPKDEEEPPAPVANTIVLNEAADKSEEREVPAAVTNSEPAPVSQGMPSSTSQTSTEPKPSVASNNTLVSPPGLPPTLVSPTGLPLKKVSALALPPGVKPLPLPLGSRPGDLCSMQIGKKVVKVQKIIMTKTEVEVMAKKGLLELKDGTMVLKQGVKLPPGDPSAALRAGLESLVTQGAARKLAAAPTRCTIDGEGT